MPENDYTQNSYSAIIVRLDRMEKSHDETRKALREMAVAITKLAVIEERQQASSTAIERLAAEQKNLDERLRHLEVSDPMQTKAAEWVQSALWALATAAAMFVAGKAGLF